MSESAVETFCNIGLKIQMHFAYGTTLIAFRMAFADVVQQRVVVCGHIFDIWDVFKSAFYLQRRCSGIEKRFQSVGLIEIAQRQQVFLFKQRVAVAVGQIVWQTAQLCAFTTVGAASAQCAAGMAASAVTHTQCSVNETFQWDGSRLAHFADFID